MEGKELFFSDISIGVRVGREEERRVGRRALHISCLPSYCFLLDGILT